MERLVVKRQGRRIFGWAYRPDGVGAPLVVELLKDGIVISQSEANLTFLQGIPFLSHSECRGHGFEFLLAREHVVSTPSSVLVRLQGGQISREVSTGSTLGCWLELHVDSVDDIGFSGWCWDPEQPDSSSAVELTLPGLHSGTPDYSLVLPANRLRPELVGSGLAGGNCGFWSHWPHQLSLNERLRTRLKFGKIELDLGAKLARWQRRGSVQWHIPAHIITL